jgi:hypothetical protein
VGAEVRQLGEGVRQVVAAGQIPAELSGVPLEQEPVELQQPATAEALLQLVLPARGQLEKPAH